MFINDNESDDLLDKSYSHKSLIKPKKDKGKRVKPYYPPTSNCDESLNEYYPCQVKFIYKFYYY